MVRVVVILAAGVAAGCGGLVQAQGTTEEGGSEATGESATEARPDDDGIADDDAAQDGTTTGGGALADSSGGEATSEAGSSDDGASSSEGSGSGEGSGGSGGPVCGDGRREASEGCDDANRSEIDGCTSSCEVGPVDLSYGDVSTTEEDGGNGTDIVPFWDDCPAGQALTGMTGRLTSQGLGAAVVLGRIQGECSSLSLYDADPTAIESAPGASLIEHGGFQEGGDWALQCPEGSVVAAFDGQAGAIIDSLVVTCTPLQIAGTGDTQTLQLGALTTDGPVGGNGGDPFGPVACPDGEIATGLAGDTNSYVIRLALRCRSVALQYP